MLIVILIDIDKGHPIGLWTYLLVIAYFWGRHSPLEYVMLNQIKGHPIGKSTFLLTPLTSYFFFLTNI